VVKPLKILIAEDDYISRRVLQANLEPYGHCDLAVNGREALDLFISAWNQWESYDLVCLDIMMPEMNGQKVLAEIRDFEAEHHCQGTDSTKVVIISALDDFKNISQAFNRQCEAYLVKPIDRNKLINTLSELGLI